MRWTLALILFAACYHDAPPPKQPERVRVQPQKQVVIKDLVQPVRIEKVEPYTGGDVNAAPDDDDVPDGVAGGPPPPPPPPPQPQQVVAPTALETYRLAGDKFIVPDDATKQAIADSGKDRVVSAYKLCVSKEGDIALVSLLKSSGFPAYDQKIQQTIRTSWRYKPYQVNGKVVPVCTAITFVYSQRP